MATKSILKNIEISDPAEAEELVKALEEAERISEEGMEKCKTCANGYPSVSCTNCGTGFRNYVSNSEKEPLEIANQLDAYKKTGLTPEQIQAQQQEIDRLKATLADWKYNTKCDADHIAALAADKDEQARKTRQLEEGLRSTLKVLETLNYRGGLGLDIHKWLRDEIQTLNTLLGSEEDEKNSGYWYCPKCKEELDGDFCNTTKLPCCGCCPCCEHRITVTSFQSGGDSLDGESRSYMGVYIRQRRTDRADEILAKTDIAHIGSGKRPTRAD